LVSRTGGVDEFQCRISATLKYKTLKGKFRKRN
jgi:hypothetical protein